MSQYEEEKKKRRNQWIISVLLLLIMFVSVIAYGFESVLFSGTSSTKTELETFNYKGLEFAHQGNFWTLNHLDKDFIFRHNPNEVGKIDSSLNGIDDYKNKPLYIYSEDFNQESEIRTNMAGFVLRIQNACPEGKTCDESLPVKTCEENFIIITEGDEKIRQEGNCVFISGKKEDLTELTDAFLFRILGIN